MAAKEVVTILGFTATADEWTAWSAVGTVGAMLIAMLALLLPLSSAWRRRRVEKAAKHGQYRELISAVTKANNLVDHATDERTGMGLLNDCAAIARYKSQTLRLLAAQPGLSEGAIDCALGAAEMLDLVVLAQRKIGLVDMGAYEEALEILDLAKQIQGSVKDRVAGVARANDVN